ncbi:rab-GTPase-TBC domain-containing protein, partial [Mucor mucedo]|uniref:rab-GTPase-TBC domain-containing protein n=1 Tax=Mucor mucedo TaxID=29922 RepID=UPI00221E8071
VRLIYAKSGFYLKSTNPMADDSIHGFFAVFSKSMENVQVNVAWIPEYLIDPKDIDLFLQLDGDVASEHGFPSIGLNLGQGETMIIGLSHIHSLYICPPSIHAQGSIVITSKSGDVLKPIWFSTTTVNDLQSDINAWPGYDIIDVLNAFIPLRPSDTQYVHLVKNDTVSSPVPKAAEEDPVTKAIHNARWTLLERLAKITQYSKDAAQALTQPIALSMQAFSRSRTVNEYQMASHYIARWGNKSEPEYYLMDDTDGLLLGMPELSGPTPIHTRRSPVSPEEWILLFDDEGRLNVPVDHVRQIVFSGGLDSDIRIEAWKFLLGIYTWHSTFDEREAIRRSQKESYYAIKATWFDDTEIRDTTEFKDEKHRIDKDVHRTDREQEAFEGEDLPNPDPAMCVGTNANLEIMKDILVTYNFYNIDLGYVQGMSDILAPLFVAMGDEAMAFWGFCSFMDRVQGNFYVDQTGMHGLLNTLKDLIRFMDPTLYQHLEKIQAHEMFFCFRWFLVWFKREFAWDQVIRLWEVLWTNHLSDQFIIFIALAVIDTHRHTMLTEINELDEMLQFFIGLSDNIPLEPTLERAEVLFYQFERKIKAMQHKSAILKDQLQIRSVWNSDQRVLIQERITKLQIPNHIIKLLSH